MDTKKLKFKTKEIEKKYKADWERDHKLVKGRFNFVECPGGELAFPFHKYPDDQPSNWNLKDGEYYELPYMVAKHLATGVFTPVHHFEKDVHGKNVARIGKKNYRTNFQKLDFEDDSFIQPHIITVEKAEPDPVF